MSGEDTADFGESLALRYTAGDKALKDKIEKAIFELPDTPYRDVLLYSILRAVFGKPAAADVPAGLAGVKVIAFRFTKTALEIKADGSQAHYGEDERLAEGLAIKSALDQAYTMAPDAAKAVVSKVKEYFDSLSATVTTNTVHENLITRVLGETCFLRGLNEDAAAKPTGSVHLNDLFCTANAG